jgi:nicotinic acid mononucleotide adenylyltransferase
LLDRASFIVINRAGRTARSLPDRLPSLADRMRVLGASEDIGSRATVHPSILLVDRATPDVSSTMVRARCAAGESIHGLVPPAVERHILRHRLYVVGANTLPPAGDPDPSAILLHEQEHR